MNVLQCASATCFCHRFAMLSCLNLIGWRGGREGSGQAGQDVVFAAFTYNCVTSRTTGKVCLNT